MIEKLLHIVENVLIFNYVSLMVLSFLDGNKWKSIYWLGAGILIISVIGGMKK